MVGVGAVATESVCFRVAALVSGLFVRDESRRKERQAVVRKAHLEPGEARMQRTCDRQGALNPRTGRTLPATCERCRRQTLVVGE